MYMYYSIGVCNVLNINLILISQTQFWLQKKPYKIKSELLHKEQNASQCSYIAQINKLVTTTMATTMNEGDHSFNLLTCLFCSSSFQGRCRWATSSIHISHLCKYVTFRIVSNLFITTVYIHCRESFKIISLIYLLDPSFTLTGQRCHDSTLKYLTVIKHTTLSPAVSQRVIQSLFWPWARGNSVHWPDNNRRTWSSGLATKGTST